MFPEMKYIKLEMNIAVGILGLLQWSSSHCMLQKERSFYLCPILASAHEPALPTTQTCSPKGRCHGHHKQNIFLIPLGYHRAWLPHKHKMYRDTNRTMQTLPRIPHSCLHQRGENSCSHGLRNNLLIPLPSGKAKSYPESLVKKTQRGCDCGLPPDPYGPSKNKCVCVCEWVCVCVYACDSVSFSDRMSMSLIQGLELVIFLTAV